MLDYYELWVYYGKIPIETLLFENFNSKKIEIENIQSRNSLRTRRISEFNFLGNQFWNEKNFISYFFPLLFLYDRIYFLSTINPYPIETRKS